MKKTLIAILALGGLAAADDTTFTTTPDCATIVGSFSTYGFAFNLSGTALTSASTPSGIELPDEVILSSISFVTRFEGEGTEVKKNGEFYIVLTDMDQTIVGWSNEKSTTPDSNTSFTWTFNDVILDTDSGYMAIAYESTTGLVKGETLTFSSGKFMEWGNKAVCNFGSNGLSFDGSIQGATGLQFLNGSATSYTLTGGSAQFAPNVTIITKSIPEPATATLSLLALAGLAMRRRRK